MFFGRMKSRSDEGPALPVPLLQRFIGLSVGLVMVWFVFAPNSPLNKQGTTPDAVPETTPATSPATAPATTPDDVATPDAQSQSLPGRADSPTAIADETQREPSTRKPQVVVAAPSPRIASMSPAITDSLAALGLAAHVVGRSPYCRSVDASLPVVGDLRDFDTERLALSAPDVLFVQPPLAGVDPSLRDYCEKHSITLVARRLESLSDVSTLVDDIAAAFGVTPNIGGTALERALGDAKASIAPGARPSEGARRVLLVVSADPFLAVGRETYLDELLGGADLGNMVERTGYVELSAEMVLALAPSTVIGLAETATGARRIEEHLRRIPWRSDARPKIAVDAIPGLLSPSLVAVAKRPELVRLAEAAQ